jgi:iron only hydrogenase large subunit-like protein
LAKKTLPSGYIHFAQDLCTACTHCVRACPTGAIRIKNEKSVRTQNLCIGCGECIRVCPTGALSVITSELESLEDKKISVAMVSPVLYAQFPGVMPTEVLTGLQQMGFQHAMDMSYYIEMFQCATEEFIARNRITGHAPWPLISPYCPVVIHLISVKFPSLLPHVLPILRPVTLMAREVRKGIVKEHGVKDKDVILYHITANRSSYPHEKSYIDRVLGINDVYAALARQVKKISKADPSPFPRDHFNNFAIGSSLMWAISGGEIAGINIDKSLAVSGVHETIAYLEKLELGLFKDLEYIEFRTCAEGCVGGGLTAVDKYLAKSTIQKMVRKFPSSRRLSREKILRFYEKGRFMAETSPTRLAQLLEPDKDPLSIDALQEIEGILERIQGLDCAACGAPDCRTFAEDVVRGRAALNDCLLLRARGNPGKKTD